MIVSAVLPVSGQDEYETGNVIFFHPDGTGLNHWNAARMFWYGADGALHWDQLPEIAIYRGGPRTADVVAEVPSTVYRLARRQLRYLEQSDPELALLVHRLCATTLAERLAIANRVVQALHE